MLKIWGVFNVFNRVINSFEFRKRNFNSRFQHFVEKIKVRDRL